ncbi:hypothetical protein DMUE_4396, partial [Dictyocoela muelleri]
MKRKAKKIVRLKVHNIIKKTLGKNRPVFDDAIIESCRDLDNEEKKLIGSRDNLRDYFVKRINAKYKKSDSDDLELLQIYKYTFDHKLFLQFDNLNKDDRIIIFSVEENLKILEKSSIWLCYGKFFTTPKNFDQTLIIHAPYFNKTLPIVYVFMKRKTENAYNIVFSYLKQKQGNIPRFINIDFETALYSAIEKNFKES